MFVRHIYVVHVVVVHFSHCYVVVNYMNTPHFIHPFYYWWTFRLTSAAIQKIKKQATEWENVFSIHV